MIKKKDLEKIKSKKIDDPIEVANEEIGEDDDKEYSDEEIAEKATMQNAQQTNEVFITPGRGKFFTDSISDAVR